MTWIPWWGELAALLAALSWAVTGLLVRAQGSGLSAISISALRSTIAGFAFLGLWPLLGEMQPIPPLTVALLIASLVAGLAVGDTLYFAAIPRIGVSRALPISMGYPLLTTALAVTLLREPIGPLSALGIAATLAGVYLVARPEKEPQGEYVTPGRTYWMGVAMAVAAAVAWSASAVLLRPALEHVDIWTASAVRAPIAALVLWLFAARVGALPERTHLRGMSLLLIGTTGVLNVLATVLFLASVASAGAARAAVLTATAPVFAVPLASLVLRERATWTLAIGTLCSVAGVTVLTLSQGG
jgi:drug/metabolite transporter (DMT)-like permease